MVSKSLKEACKTKNIIILKPLKTIENLSSSKNYNNCIITTTNCSSNNDAEIPISNNAHLALPQWDIFPTTFDATRNSDNGRLIDVISSTSIETETSAT